MNDEHLTPSEPSRSTVRATWVAGPDAGHHHRLDAGRHVLGRAAACPLRADDPTLAPFHAVLDVDPSGGTNWHRLVRGGSGSGTGSSRITLTADGDSPEVPRSPGIVLRRPRHLPPPPSSPTPSAPTPPVDDHGRPSLAGALPSLVGLAAALVLAAATGQWTFAVFGVMGSAVGLVVWALGAVGDRRAWRRRHDRWEADRLARDAQLTAARAALADHHRATVRTLADALDTALTDHPALWERRPADPDALVVAVGPGDIAWPPSLAPDPIGGPAGFEGTVTVDLAAVGRLAIVGDPAAVDALLRALLVQLVVALGPADLAVVVAHDVAAADRWSWLADAPHRHDGEPGGRPITVVVADHPELLASPTAPLRRLLERDPSVILLARAPHGTTVPHVCRGEIRIDPAMGCRIVVDRETAGLPLIAHGAGLAPARAAAVTAVLADCVDPESPVGAMLPDEVPLAELVAMTPGAVAARWAEAAIDTRPVAVLGVAAHPAGLEPATVDLAADGPHALIGGTTGSGKSELLRTLVLSLAAMSPPEALQFVLVDFKGGAAFAGLARLPHVVATVTDLDEPVVGRCLRALDRELRRREAVLADVGAADLASWREGGGHGLARLVVVIDEFAALAANRPHQLRTLVDIAQRGRSLGVHLILATQRPAGVITDDLRANTALRLALRLHDATDAMDVVGDTAPAMFPRHRPGRTMLRLGEDRIVFHAARPDIESAVEAIDEAAASTDRPRATPLWSPPLPDQVSWSAADPDAVGVLDDEPRARHVPLRVPDGNLLVVGPQSRTRPVVDAVVLGHRRAGRAVYVIGGRLDHHRLGAEIVAIDDDERLHRLWARLAGDIDRELDHDVVLVIDALERCRTIWDHEHLDRLDDIRRAGSVRLVVVADHAGAVPTAWSTACEHRWVTATADRGDAHALGIAPDDLPPPVDGRIAVADVRGFVGMAQVVEATLPTDPGTPTPVIDLLPAHVSSVDLDGEPPDDTRLLVGMSSRTLTSAWLDVSDGALAIGPPRSGRSTVLAQLIADWRRRHDGVVVALAPRRTSLQVAELHRDAEDAWRAVASVAHDRPVLVAIDDAELVDSVPAALSAVHVTVIAATTPEALRSAYGHWLQPMRRARTGVVMAATDHLDGDLLGVTLPRRTTIAARPGLAWCVDHGEITQVQVALPSVEVLRPTLSLATGG